MSKLNIVLPPKEEKLTRARMLKLQKGDKIKIVDHSPSYSMYDWYKDTINEGTVVEVYKSAKFDRIKYSYPSTDYKGNYIDRITNITIGKKVKEDGTMKCAVSGSSGSNPFERTIFLINE